MDETLHLPSADELYDESPLSAARLTEMISHAVDPETPHPEVELPDDVAADPTDDVDLSEFDESDESDDITDTGDDPDSNVADDLFGDVAPDRALDSDIDTGIDADGADGGASPDYDGIEDLSPADTDSDDPLAGF